MPEDYSRIKRTELSGIPTYWAPSAESQTQVALIFRVGRADEGLADSGKSHLVEHLALFRQPLKRGQFGGFVDHARTVFFASGTDDEVAGFLRSVTRSLRELPMDRFDLERRVLLTEAASAGRGSWERVVGLRFGAVGYGVAAFEELGLRRLVPADVTEWSAARYTKGNAAIWIHGRLPDDLQLELNEGPSWPPIEPTARPRLTLPGYSSGRPGDAAASYMGQRSAALMTAMAILEDRCHQRLRLNEALSYQVFASYVPFTASVAHITLGADCLDQHAAAVLDALLEEVNRLATDGPMGDELAALVQDREALLHEPVTRHELDSAATTALFGGSVQTREQLTSEYTALTSDCVAQALAGVLDTAIVIGPDLEQPPHDLALLTSAHNAPVTGRRYWGRGSKRFARPRRGNIVVSNDGVSFLRGGADNPVTVKFAEVAALLRHNDNLFKLIANDGAWVWFDAARLFRGDQLKAHIEKSVAQELIIPPENEPGDDALNS